GVRTFIRFIPTPCATTSCHHRAGQALCRGPPSSLYNLQSIEATNEISRPAMSTALNLHTIVSMPFEENTYVVWLPGRQDCLVVDPGLEPDAILEFLRDQELTPAALLNTHGHPDHIAGNTALKEAFPEVPLLIG